SPVASKFFSVFMERWNNVLASDDKKFIAALRKSVTAVIEKRNRYMHDAWLMGSTSAGTIENEFALVRVRNHSGGVEFTSKSISIDQLRRDSSEIETLRKIVLAMTFYENPDVPGPNISARFRLDNEGKPVIIRLV
ncbi:MAG: hypothetical protein M3R08_12265, partial [Bacteroidota bacterium]|nr:hypothetical protein [Bacteroidota bacterium]